jgi:hypothetical protein
MQCASNIIIEKTYKKVFKNFEYFTPAFLKRYFNDYNNHMLIGRKIKKLRLINDFLPYNI